MTDSQRVEAKDKWIQISRAYECLTDETKFNNWKEYGSPEGSLMWQTFDVAMPSFLMEEDNQIYLLLAFFLTFICVPIVVLAKTRDTNDKSELYFRNGIHKASAGVMVSNLIQSIEKNMKKKVKTLSDDQFIEVMESSQEMQQINFDLGKKIIIRDLIRNKIQGLSVSDKFADAESQILDKIPRLNYVLIGHCFSEVKFLRFFAQFNKDAAGKTKYTVDGLLSQLTQFTNKVMKQQKNGYKGYEFSISQKTG